MFCPVCGNNCADEAKFCSTCGYSFAAVTPVQPVAPTVDPYIQPTQPAQPDASVAAPAGSSNPAIAMVKEYMKFIILAVSALALILALFNFGGQFDISATVSYNGKSETATGPVADIIESGEKPMILVGNLLFGFANLAIAAVGILYFLKELKNLSIYDDFIGKIVPFGPLALMGIVGAASALLQILCYLISGESQTFFGQTVSYSFGANWTTWAFLFVYGGMAAADFLFLNKKSS